MRPIRQFIQREVIRRRLPHGLLSPLYLLPTKNKRVTIHRQLWWQSGQRWPRIIWLILETWLWLRWVFVHALPACLRINRRLGPVVEREEKITRKTQFVRVLKPALLWSIPPTESYRFRLYSYPEKALDYIYNNETGAYHAWLSNPLGWRKTSRDLIQDKARFTDFFAQKAIPVVSCCKMVTGIETIATVEQCLQQHARLFCKTNSGNQGRGAFTVWMTEKGLTGRTFTGQILKNSREVESAWQKLVKLDKVLIQPCLDDHPSLKPLACNDDVITVRLISQWQGEALAGLQPGCLSATLEVPAGVGKKGAVFYAILPIDPETGGLSAPMRPLARDAEVTQAIERIETEAGRINKLPFWSELVEAGFAAHRFLPDIYAIAWDWVITPAGPVLPEGNSGWGCATPPLLHGAFLAEAPYHGKSVYA